MLSITAGQDCVAGLYSQSHQTVGLKPAARLLQWRQGHRKTNVDDNIFKVDFAPHLTGASHNGQFKVESV